MSQIENRQRLRDKGRLKVATEIDLSFQPAVERVTIAQQEEMETRPLRTQPQELPTPFEEFTESLTPVPPPPLAPVIPADRIRGVEANQVVADEVQDPLVPDQGPLDKVVRPMTPQELLAEVQTPVEPPAPPAVPAEPEEPNEEP